MLSNVICLFFLLSGHTCYSFLFWFVDLTFFGRRNGLFWQVSHTQDKQVTRLVVIYWSLAGPQPTDQVLEAPSVWKMPLQTRSANLKGPLLLHWLKWSLRSFSQTRRVTLRSESAHLSAHFVPCHYQLGSLYKLSNSLAHSVLLLFRVEPLHPAAPLASTPRLRPSIHLQTLFIYGSPGGSYWSLLALALAG